VAEVGRVVVIALHRAHDPRHAAGATLLARDGRQLAGDGLQERAAVRRFERRAAVMMISSCSSLSATTSVVLRMLGPPNILCMRLIIKVCPACGFAAGHFFYLRNLSQGGPQ